MPENFKLSWDNSGEHYYETGVKRGVLYVADSNGAYPNGVVWNGLSSITESPSGAEANPIYADDIKYLNLYSAEDFGATIEAYSYPDEFAQCNGQASLATGVLLGQQDRKTFGVCYRTILGNDVDGDNYGYKIHIIYGAKASPSEKQFSSVNDSPEPITMSWEITTIPVNVAGFKPTAYMEIDSTKADATKLAALEQILYGTPAVEAAAAVYAAVPADATFDNTKTYYTKDGTTYTEATGLASFANGTTYYTMTSAAVEAAAAVEARLPLPDEIATIMAAA